MKSIRRNYIYNTAYQVLILLVPLVQAPYLSRVLGPDGVGTVSYAESIIAYFTLFAAMGISTYGQREISYVRDNIDKRSEVFWNAKLLETCSFGIVFAVYIAFIVLQHKTAIYFVLMLNLVSVLVDITWFFQGLEEFGKIVARNTVIRCLQLVFVFSFVNSKDDLLIYVFAIGLFSVLGNASLWFYLPFYIKKVTLAQLHPFRDIKVVWSLFVPTIAIQIYTVLDKTMIGLITHNSFENGFYEQAIKISKMLLSVITALGTVMVPRIGYHFGQNNQEEIQRLMYRGYRFVWFLGIPLCLGLIAVAGNFVPWFFGEGYDAVIPLLRILSFLILAIGISNVTGTQYFIPTKRQNLFTMTVLTGAVVNFSLNMVLINFFRSFGAAVASVAAEVTITIVQLILVRKELSPRRVLREGIHYYLAGLGMLLVLWLIGKHLSPSPLHTACMVVCGAAIYFIALFAQRDEFFIFNAKKVLKKMLSFQKS